jgi:uncharacterized protein with HEPN domain
MHRDYRLFLDDILEAVERIRRYTSEMDYETFKGDTRTQDAVVRNLEVIGEAARSLPDDVKARAPEIEWRKIVGLRNILVHEYFGASLPIIWDVVVNKLDILRAACKRLCAGPP